jgi:aminoglycoside phosphotransferase (APT) family kinase protein
VPVPSLVGLVEDTSVIGAPFYLMRWLDGHVIDTPQAAASFLTRSEWRQRAAFELVDGLAALHSVDIRSGPLASLSSHDNYIGRQIERLRKTWDRTKSRDLPIVESVATQLLAARPLQRYTGLVHSDYRFGNAMVDETGRLIAILDWELCAIGDVLVDLGFLLNSWDEPGDPSPGVWMEEAPTRAGGFPTRVQIAAHYASRTGTDIEDFDYYRAFGYWKICILAAGIKRRYQSGAMSEGHVDLDQVERKIEQRAALAQQFLERWTQTKRPAARPG